MSNLGKILLEKGYEVLPRSFYNREDVVKVAKELLGKVLFTYFDGNFTAGRIIETEAYNGAVDRASHAYGNRRTKRTEVMFGQPGIAYVYLCYGIHHLFNVVTNSEQIPHAVLIRSIEPLCGIEIMQLRTKKRIADNSLGKGPGNVSKALGITTADTGTDLLSGRIRIASDNYTIATKNIKITTRIGVDYAGPDALLPYRFVVDQNVKKIKN